MGLESLCTYVLHTFAPGTQHPVNGSNNKNDIYYFLCASNCSKSFANINSFHPCNNPTRKVQLLSPIFLMMKIEILNITQVHVALAEQLSPELHTQSPDSRPWPLTQYLPPYSCHMKEIIVPLQAGSVSHGLMLATGWGSLRTMRKKVPPKPHAFTIEPSTGSQPKKHSDLPAVHCHHSLFLKLSHQRCWEISMASLMPKSPPLSFRTLPRYLPALWAS